MNYRNSRIVSFLPMEEEVDRCQDVSSQRIAILNWTPKETKKSVQRVPIEVHLKRYSGFLDNVTRGDPYIETLSASHLKYSNTS
jgi:hypothetical protein